MEPAADLESWVLDAADDFTFAVFTFDHNLKALFSFFVDLAFKSSIVLLQASIEVFSQFCYFYAAARLLAFVPLAWYAFL